jgi:hypothetical protein
VSPVDWRWLFQAEELALGPGYLSGRTSREAQGVLLVSSDAWISRAIIPSAKTAISSEIVRPTAAKFLILLT